MFQPSILIFKEVVLLFVLLEMVDFFFETGDHDILLVCFHSHVRDNLCGTHLYSLLIIIIKINK